MSALAVIGFCALSAGAFWIYRAVVMPGDPRGNGAASLDAHILPDLEHRLRTHLNVLTHDIGPRHHWRSGSLDQAADYIVDQFQSLGYSVHEQSFAIEAEDAKFRNLEVELPSVAAEADVLVIGAHYDTVPGSPGADDNASGVAALLEIARDLAGTQHDRAIRLVAFVNEEEPFAGTDSMGSIVYAQAMSASPAQVKGMIALESLGYYRTEAGTQRYPAPLSWCYPNTGDFLGFVSNVLSRSFLREAIASFRVHGALPSEGLSLPAALAPDIGRSDHAAFWRRGYPAIMITDTVPFRNPFYHTKGDTMATLDFHRYTLAVHGLKAMIRDLARRK
jgi:hypothetical protein